MLKIATIDIEQEINELILEGGYKYLNCMPYVDKDMVQITPTDEEEIQRVSVDDYGNILGYFQCTIDRSRRLINETVFVKFKYKYIDYFREYNVKDEFDTMKEIAYTDFRQFFDEIYNNPFATRLSIKSVADNPANRIYEGFAKEYNGTIINKPKEFLLKDGKYYDGVEYWFITGGVE